MIRTQVYIPEDLYLRAKNMAHIRGTSVSILLRDGLKASLVDRATPKKQKKKNPFGDFKPIYTGIKGVEAALNHNDIYDL